MGNDVRVRAPGLMDRPLLSPQHCLSSSEAISMRVTFLAPSCYLVSHTLDSLGLQPSIALASHQLYLPGLQPHTPLPSHRHGLPGGEAMSTQCHVYTRNVSCPLLLPLLSHPRPAPHPPRLTSARPPWR